MDTTKTISLSSDETLIILNALLTEVTRKERLKEDVSRINALGARFVDIWNEQTKGEN